MKIILYTIAHLFGFPGLILAAHITYNLRHESHYPILLWAFYLALIIP